MFFLIFYTSYLLHFLNLICLTALFPIYYSITGVVDWVIGGEVDLFYGRVVFYRGLLLQVSPFSSISSYLLFLLICFTSYHLHFSSSSLHASFNSYLLHHLVWLIWFVGCFLCGRLVVLLIGSVVFYRGLLLMFFSYLLFLLICFTTYHLHFTHPSILIFLSTLERLICFWGMLLVQWIGCEVDWLWGWLGVSHSSSVLYTYNFLPLNVAD